MSRSFVTILLLALAWPGFGQQVTGSITGAITDHTGSVIAGASVKLKSESTSAVREVSTDSVGSFTFNAIQAGDYTLTAQHKGFKTHTRTRIELAPNQNLAMGDIKLDVGEVSESITVAAEASVVQISSGERSGVITADEVENLTVLNRDFSMLVALLPGVVDTAGTAEVQGFSSGTSFNVAGNRSTGNSITVDGGAVENTNGGNGNNFVSMDSVQTVRIVTSNYQAEFGRKPGAGIMAVTKSGSQRYHGAAYWYYRHEWMNANDFFNNRQSVAATPRRVQTPGFNIGGPAYIPGKFNSDRSKLFFFASLELIREKRPQSIRNLTMPTALERSGDFTQSFNTNGTLIRVNDPLNNKTQFPGNIIPASRLNANGQNYLKLLPVPNGVNRAIAGFNYNYQVQESLEIPKVAHSSRVDYVVNPKTTIWFKYNYWWEDQRGWAVSAGNANWGWMPSHYIAISHAPVLSVTHILTPKTILELSARVTRWTESGAAVDETYFQKLNRKNAGFNVPQLYPQNNPHNLLPNATFNVTNSPNTSLNERFPLRGAETPVYTDAIVTRTQGPHVFKFGLYGEWWKAVKGEAGNWNGTFTFSTDTNNPNDAGHSFANALLGNFTSYTESNTRPPLYETSKSIEGFAQDNWKITRRLTLDLGLRLGWSTPFYSQRRQEAGFVPWLWNPKDTIKLMTPVRVNNARRAQDPITGEIYPATVIGAIAPGTGNPYNGTVNLLTDANYPHGLRENSGLKAAPRFGFAWDPFGKGKTAIRGGFGLFYEIHEKDLWTYSLHRDPPNQLSPTIYYGSLDSFVNTSGFLFPSNTSGLTPNRVLARTMSYSFGIQQSVGHGLMIDAAYVATLGRHLFGRSNLNSIAAGTTFTPQAQDPSNPGNVYSTQYLRPYLGYGEIYWYSYDNNSSYHSLQVTANRRIRRGLQGGLAWTWSKAMDYVDNETTNMSALVSPKVWNYGKAGFDRTHILKGNWIYDVPRGSRWVPGTGVGKVLGKALFDGWKLSGIMTMMSGAPTGVSLGLTVGGAGNWSGSPTDGARPMMVANATLPKGERTFERYFNTEAFAVGPRGTLGNAPKDVFRGPGINNWDVSLFKDFKMTEKWRAQFRCEGYNVLNHTQFSSVNTSANFNATTLVPSNPQLGQMTATRLPRRMQLALRLTF
jgi:hypothetical protein